MIPAAVSGWVSELSSDEVGEEEKENTGDPLGEGGGFPSSGRDGDGLGEENGTACVFHDEGKLHVFHEFHGGESSGGVENASPDELALVPEADSGGSAAQVV